MTNHIYEEIMHNWVNSINVEQFKQSSEKSEELSKPESGDNNAGDDDE